MLSPQSQLPAQSGQKRGGEHGCLGGPWPRLQLGWGFPNQQPEAWAETGQRCRGRDRDGFSEGSEVCLWLQAGVGELRGRFRADDGEKGPSSNPGSTLSWAM